MDCQLKHCVASASEQGERVQAKVLPQADPFAGRPCLAVQLCPTAALHLPPARRVLGECQMDASEALRLQAAMGYGLEDTQMIIESMAQVCCAALRCAVLCVLRCA